MKNNSLDKIAQKGWTPIESYKIVGPPGQHEDQGWPFVNNMIPSDFINKLYNWKQFYNFQSTLY